MKIINSLNEGGEILKKNNISSYKIDCEILMSQTLNISREELILNLGGNIKKEEKKEYFNLFHFDTKWRPFFLSNAPSVWIGLNILSMDKTFCQSYKIFCPRTKRFVQGKEPVGSSDKTFCRWTKWLVQSKRMGH